MLSISATKDANGPLQLKKNEKRVVTKKNPTPNLSCHDVTFLNACC